MGANQQTSVPAFVASQVLTAQQVTEINTGVPVFADSTARTNAFGGTGEKVLAEGQLSYLESDGKIYVYNGTSWVSISSVTKVDAFTASGTWTVPAGVTYAIAHIRGGGGGVNTSAGAGGASSVAFAGGTISAAGGNANEGPSNGFGSSASSCAGAVNSGNGATGVRNDVSIYYTNISAGDGAYVVAGDDVTPGGSITVTVGAGGTAGTNGAAGGSGYVWIEYQE